MAEQTPTTVYVVLYANWHWTDDAWAGDNAPVAAYRSREEAEEHCRRLTEAAHAEIRRTEEEGDYASEFEETDWRYEVVELVLDHDPSGAVGA